MVIVSGIVVGVAEESFGKVERSRGLWREQQVDHDDDGEHREHGRDKGCRIVVHSTEAVGFI
jgi:hypothetical protein